MTCWRCGRLHRANWCRFKNYTCDECGRKGHLKSMCRVNTNNEKRRVNDKSSQYKRQNYLDSDSNSDCELYCLNVCGLNDRPYCVRVQVNGLSLNFELDTGTMPWGWECRAKLVKQTPAKPTKSRRPVSGALKCPAPNHYETPEIFCGKGYSLIKRAPAFTFGHRTPFSQSKPPILKSAPLLDVSGSGRKGNYKIKHGVVSPRIEPPQETFRGPGPGTYEPRNEIVYKRPPEYSMRPAAKPPYQPWDQWTPSPNMYWPRIPGKKSFPAYTFGCTVKKLTTQIYPSPGDHEPKFEYVQKSKPAYSFGAPYKSSKPANVPPPNTYCEKRFMYPKRTIPAPSFGIRHTKYLGKQQEYLKSSKLDIVIPGEV